MAIPMVTPVPMMVLGALFWSFRTGALLRRHPAARRVAVPLGLVVAAVLFATVWMLLFYVPGAFLPYCILPVVTLLLGRAVRRRCAPAAHFIHAAALAQACAAPAFFFSFYLRPLDLLFSAPVWNMAFLFSLSPRLGRLFPCRSVQFSPALQGLGLLLLLVLCCVSSVKGPDYESTMYLTIAIGAGCLQGGSVLRRHAQGTGMVERSFLPLIAAALLGLWLFGAHPRF